MKRNEKKVAYKLIKTIEITMAKKLYIGGLSYGTTDESLKQAFAEVGEVESAVIIMDRATNRSKGFGFVEMASEEGAQAAIDRFNGAELEGRKITVNEARPMTDKPRRDFNRGGGSGGGFNRDRRSNY